MSESGGFMLYIIILGLTLGAVWYIIRIAAKIKEKSYNKTIRRQSDMHSMMKGFFDKKMNNDNTSSQLKKRKEKRSVRVIVIEQKAYWVTDNTFYVADAIDGQIRRETAKPVNTESMSSRDVKKMWFILDKLESRENNDSGGARNS